MRSTLRAALTKSRARAEAVRLEQLRHLRDRQPFGKCDPPRVDVAARELVDDVERRHRAIEAVLAGLELASLPASTRARRGRGARR